MEKQDIYLLIQVSSPCNYNKYNSLNKYSEQHSNPNTLYTKLHQGKQNKTCVMKNIMYLMPENSKDWRELNICTCKPSNLQQNIEISMHGQKQ